MFLLLSALVPIVGLSSTFRPLVASGGDLGPYRTHAWGGPGDGRGGSVELAKRGDEPSYRAINIFYRKAAPSHRAYTLFEQNVLPPVRGWGRERLGERKRAKKSYF